MKAFTLLVTLLFSLIYCEELKQCDEVSTFKISSRDERYACSDTEEACSEKYQDAKNTVSGCEYVEDYEKYCYKYFK